MQIDRLKVTNFKSIPELDLNFQEMSGLWEISGVVGAGKTTIGEAILYGLFGTVRGKTNDSLIMWDKKHALVEVWLYCRNRHIYISREINSYGQSPMAATVDGEDLVAPDKRSIQSILENEWYDIARPVLELLCVISFNNFKSLSTLSTQESREFLNSTISFDKLQWYEDWCKEQIDILNKEANKKNTELFGYQSSLQTLADTQPIPPRYKSIEELERIIANHEEELDNIREQLDKELSGSKDEASRIMTQITSNDSQLKTLRSTLKKLSGVTCPLCGGQIDDDHRQSMASTVSRLKNEVKDLTKELTQYNTQIRDKEQEAKEKTDRISKIITDLRGEIKITIGYTKELERRREMTTKYNDLIAKIEDEMKMIDDQIFSYTDMISYLKTTVRPTIISSIIPSINRYIEYYMSSAHQNYVVQYDENFKCLVKNPYGEMMPITSLSTGQKKVIDMIVMLAFIRTFVAQIDFNIYFLDELIGNVDADLRDTMCSLLRESMDEKGVMFLISHSPINPQWLDGTIKVTRNAGISQYEIVEINK